MTLQEAIENLIDYYGDDMESNKYVREEWQTLKTAVLAQQTNNTGSPKCLHERGVYRVKLGSEYRDACNQCHAVLDV